MLCTNQHPRSNLGLLEVSNAEKRKSFPENIFPESNTEARLLALNKMQNIMTLDEIPDLGGRSQAGSLRAAQVQCLGTESSDICPLFSCSLQDIIIRIHVEYDKSFCP